MDELDDGSEMRVVEAAFGRESVYTLAEVAAAAGVEVEDLRLNRASFGITSADERIYDEVDVRRAATLRTMLDRGVPLASLLEINRVVGRSLYQVAAASRAFVMQTALATSAEPTEEEVLGLVGDFAPVMETLLGFVWTEHLRQIARSELVAGLDLGAREVSVAFADLVGFTRLGESMEPADIGRLAGLLEQVTDDLVEPPVRLVKTIGDAVMLVAPEPAELLATAFALVEVDVPDLPQLRVGIASGPALERAGDWYGRPVNLASRLCGLARPASIVATEEVRRAVPDLTWSALPPRDVKGVGTLTLHRARRG